MTREQLNDFIDERIYPNSENEITAAKHNAVDKALADYAEDYADEQVESEVSNRDAAISAAISQEVNDRNSAIASAIASEVSARNSAISTAISQEVNDRNTAIGAAISIASPTPTTIVTMGVTRMSTFVSLDTILPNSAATIAISNTANGPPASPIALAA